MPEYYGNLALQRRRPVIEKKYTRKLKTASRPTEYKTRRIPVTATPAPEMASMAKARAIRRHLALQRLKMMLGIVLAIVLVTGVFALVVYRQAMILEMNFSNLAIEQKITKINQESGQISEALAQKTNLDQIRRLAVEKLGLQDPARRQIVTVNIPDTDRVVFASPSISSSDDEVYLASVFQTIEGYFKTLSLQRQGD